MNDTTPIRIIMRMCPDSRTPISGGERPEWFSKEKILQNLLATKDEHTTITVLFDGDISAHWITKYPVEKFYIHAGSGDASFFIQLQFVMEQIKTDETIVYILEDDYVHKPGWPRILREAFGMSILPKSVKIDYATLYDHRDKYFYEMYDTLVSKVLYTPSIHWRTIPSTTNTFAMTYKTLKEDIDIHIKHLNADNNKFLELGKAKGRIIASCIPGFSTHSHKEYLSPCVDWEDILK